MSSEAIESLLAEASRLYNDGDYRRAIQKWQEVLSLDPANQKAKESIKIATLLSDTWTESATDQAAAPGGAPARTPEQQQVEDGLARVREKLASRDFRGALAEGEALAPLAGGSEELRSLTDQARSGIESEPFIRAALERAGKELELGHFEMVEVLCRKILSLDAANRQARTFLYMAQRRTSGQGEPGTAEQPSPEEAAAPPAPEAEPPQEPEAAPAHGGGGAESLAGLADELGADISPLDLAGAEGVAGEPTASGGVEPGSVPVSAFERGEEIDASKLESIPLGAPRPAPSVRSGSELIQDGSVYEGPDPDEIQEQGAPGAGTPATGAAAGSPGAPPAEDLALASPYPEAGTGSTEPPSAVAAASATRGTNAPESHRPPVGKGRPEPVTAAAPRPGKTATSAVVGPSARPSRAEGTAAVATRPMAAASSGQGRSLKAAAALILLLGALAGAAYWWVSRNPARGAEPSAPAVSPARPPKPTVTPVSGPAQETPKAPAATGGRTESPAGAAPGSAGGAPVNPEAQSAGGPTGGTTSPESAPKPRGEAGAAVPDDPDARAALAQKRYDEGRVQFDRGSLSDAKRLLTEALEIDPMQFEARDLLDQVDRRLVDERKFEDDVQTVRRSFEAHDYHSALWKLYRLQETFPEGRGWDRNIAAAWYNWGVTLLKAGNCREAEEKFNEVLSVYPQDREAIRQRTVAERYLQRDKDSAYYAYVDGLSLRPLEPMGKKRP